MAKLVNIAPNIFEARSLFLFKFTLFQICTFQSAYRVHKFFHDYKIYIFKILILNTLKLQFDLKSQIISLKKNSQTHPYSIISFNKRKTSIEVKGNKANI